MSMTQLLSAGDVEVLRIIVMDEGQPISSVGSKCIDLFSFSIRPMDEYVFSTETEDRGALCISLQDLQVMKTCLCSKIPMGYHLVRQGRIEDDS